MPKHETKKAEAISEKNRELWVKVTELEARIQEAKFHGKTWVIVDEDVLTHLAGGTYPTTDYIFYKDVRLVMDGKVEIITARENRTVFDPPEVKA